MNKKIKTLFIVIFIIIFLPVFFFMKAPVADYFARRTLLKTAGVKWESLFLGFHNRPWLPFNEERSQFKRFILSSLTFEVPEKKLSKLFKAKIVCADGSIVYLWFSPYAWCFSDNKGKIGKLYRVKHFPLKYHQKLFFITSFNKPLNKPPQLPDKMSECARDNLELFFEDINSSSSINVKRLAAYFQMLHDHNTLAGSPYKNISSAKEKSEYLLKHKEEITYKDFLINTGAID